MSWVQHKKPSTLAISASSTPPSSVFLSSTHSSLSLNNNSYNTTNRNANSLRQVCDPITSAAQQVSNSLLMTSQYSKAKSSLQPSTPAAMRVNTNSPYQNVTQQQLNQQQSTPSQHHQQQQPPPPSHQFNNALQQPKPTQVSQQTVSAVSNASNLQGVFSSQQQNPWPSQQSGYLPSAKTIQTTLPPTNVSAAPSSGPVNSWPEKSQQVPQNFQNVNTFSALNTSSHQQQQWPQNTQQTSTYDNYYQQQPPNNNMYQQHQLPNAQQHVAQGNQVAYFPQQQLQTSQNQSNAANFFDQSNNNDKQAASADGWSDWDWNDNSATSTQPSATDQTEKNSQPTLQQPQNIMHQQTNINSSALADSFNTQNNKDSWNWGSNENDQQVVSNKETPKLLDNLNATQNYDWNWNNHVSQTNDHLNDNWNLHSTTENPQQLTATQELFETNNKFAEKPAQIDSSLPPPPPPTEFTSSISENHNYNTNSATTPPNNIPNPVFVTQAKPVTLPSRQYASPASGNNANTENTTEAALMPPQGFQNAEDPYQKPVNAPPAAPAVAIVPPPPAVQSAANTSGNPFKRSGVAQHHRAIGLMANTSATGQASEPSAFNMPPPPPADFANPSMVALMEPDNNEFPSQENQEVLALPNIKITLPNATIQPSAALLVPNNNVVTQATPPNDERNQYLQTSHLSENSEEQQPPELDSQLPPPGLSRLVLGEPELEASQQRMVTGTEAPNADNAVTQAAAMHLEERHADGEDTASENALPISSIGQVATISSLSSDRNLYMVPGESNTANNNPQQRVVTGVELAEQREIEMDGENLEDEQIQQHQYQQHQHHTQNHQHQHQHSALSAEARNEPPVEGADDTVALVPPPLAPTKPGHANDQHLDQQSHHSANQLSKIKDSNAISSANDDDDSDDRLLNDRGMNQSTAGSAKSRTKYENERLAAMSRRRDKRSSAERYESDEYINSEGEYSSEREERERRERDRRRNYREGSVRSDRAANDDDDKRTRRQRIANKRDKYYYEGEDRQGRGGRDERERERERERDRGAVRPKGERHSQRQRGYEADSRYETEESTRLESRKDPLRRSTRRNDAEYDDYTRRGGAYRSSKRAVDNYESERRDRRRSDKHREPRYREEPRYDAREYEDYRKHSSRNARDSDVDKDGAAPLRSGRTHHDPRHAASAMYGYYDPYTAYYYQQMARTNPQAYAEWYKKYYGQSGGGITQGQASGLLGASNTSQADTSLPVAGNDGRESVHSGRSSAHNDIKDRYTHAYITQANDYHRHYQQQQQHLHLQHFHQQHQQQMAFNQSLNSTMLDEENLNHNSGMFSGLGSLSLARSNTNLSQIHGGYYMPATVSTAAGVYYARSDYAESRSGALSLRDAETISQDPQRLTPCKFITEHAVVNFASGILVTVKPKYTSNGSVSNIVKLLKFKPNDETRKLFKVFPGPLVRGLTHKKTVIEFCQEQIRLGPMDTTIYAKQLTINNAEKYRGSYSLMWNLLILLLKQNGMVVGTDIAELLLKNQQQFPFQTAVSSANNSLKSKSGSNSPTEVLDLTKDAAVEPTATLQIKTAQREEEHLPEVHDKLQEAEEADDDSSLTKSSTNSSTSLTESEITEKFRNYLLYGNVNEALEWATDNNLWGHALFLASKLDRRSHANVMMKFANKLSLNDPLQTLYQLMSGRTPSSVTCVQDEKWGDWRPHLSMILSNTSQKPELDRKSITTLGDSLFNRGDLYAAHFCYLMAQVGFGRYQESATQETSLQQHLPKLVLLGSSQYKHFKDFAHNESIIMTEIYEYACALNDDKFSIVEFQPYKFLLATRLLDYGFHLKSLMYLEQIAKHIARDASKYESSFINKVYEMADRLKYYDPVLEKTVDDQQPGSDDNNGLNLSSQMVEEQQWLQQLRQLAQNYKVNFNTSSTILRTVSQDPLQQPQTQDNSYYNQQQHQQQQKIDQQFIEINKQFSELNLQYQQQTAGENIEQQQQQIFYNSEQQQQQKQPSVDLYQQQTKSQQSLQTEHLLNQSAKDLQQPVQDVYQQQPSQYLQPDITQNSAGYNSNYYDLSQYNAADAAAGAGAGANNNLDHYQPANYDYWSQQQQQASANQLLDGNTRPTISMPKSKTYDTEDEASSKKLQHQQNSNNAIDKKQQLIQQQQKGAKKEEANKNQQQSSNSQNSGWFGGIWNKFSLKPKNQMILPDDKNPSIVWDPERKKWINTDGDEDEQEALKPPPKMSDLMPQQQQQRQQPQQPQIFPHEQQGQTTNQINFMDSQSQQQQQLQQQHLQNSISHSAPSPNTLQQQQNLNQTQAQVPGPSKTPTLQSNMFKMQRNRTLKNAYVDVFNPSGAPVNKDAENILAPALPPATVPQSGFFIPGSQSSIASGGGSSQEQQYQHNQQQQQQQQQHQLQSQEQDILQFYNPNQFTGATGY